MSYSNDKEYVEIDALNSHETHDAVLFNGGAEDEFWVPKSLMEDWPDKGKEGTAMIEEWFAIQEKLI